MFLLKKIKINILKTKSRNSPGLSASLLQDTDPEASSLSHVCVWAPPTCVTYRSKRAGMHQRTGHISALERQQGQEHSRALALHLFAAPVHRTKMLHGQQECLSWSLWRADQTLPEGRDIPNSDSTGMWYPCLTCLSPSPDAKSLGEGLSVVHSLRHGYAQAHTCVHLMRHVESKCTQVGAHTQVHTAHLMIPHVYTHAHTQCLSHTLARSHTHPTVPSSPGPLPPALAPGLVPSPLVSPLLRGWSPHKGGGARGLQSRMKGGTSRALGSYWNCLLL